MVCQMWTPTANTADQPARRAWGVGAVRGEAIGAKEQLPDQALLPETSMIQDTGLVNSAPLQMPSQLQFARCASNVGELRRKIPV